MDNSLFRWINRLANRTGWAHGFFTAYAKYGIVLFAALLIVAEHVVHQKTLAHHDVVNDCHESLVGRSEVGVHHEPARLFEIGQPVTPRHFAAHPNSSALDAACGGLLVETGMVPVDSSGSGRRVTSPLRAEGSPRRRR